MSWSNKKEAYDDGFDDGYFVALSLALVIVSLGLYAYTFMLVMLSI